MAKKKKKKKKGTVRVKRYVTVTKTVVKKSNDAKSASSSTAKSSAYIAQFAGLKLHVRTKSDGSLDILTMDEVSQEVSANWADHEIIGRKYPKAEYLGANNRTFNMTVVVDRMWGQSPHGVIKKLHDFCEKGKTSELYVGSHKIGNKWKIESMSEEWNSIYNKGQLVKVSITLTLSTYS